MTTVTYKDTDLEAFTCYSLIHDIVPQLPFKVDTCNISNEQFEMLGHLINSWYDVDYDGKILKMAFNIIEEMDDNVFKSLCRSESRGSALYTDKIDESTNTRLLEEETLSSRNQRNGDSIGTFSAGPRHWFRS